MEDLVVSVGADITGFLSKIDAAKAKVGQLVENQQALKTSIKNLNTAFVDNEKKVADLTATMSKLGSVAGAKLKPEIDKLRQTSKNLSLQLNEQKVALATTTKELNLANKAFVDAEKGTTGFGKGAGKAFGALKQLANIIPGLGISGILLLVGGPIVDAFQKWFAKTHQVSDATKLLKENLANLNSVMSEANKDAGKQTADLKILYTAATNVNLSMQDRLAAAKALNKEFPETFGNFTAEQIALGKAKTAYDETTVAILANARAKAAKSKIDDIEAKKLDNLDQRRKIENATTNERNKILKDELENNKKNAAFLAAHPLEASSRKLGTEGLLKAVDDRKKAALKLVDINDKSLIDQENFITDFAKIPTIAKVIEDGLDKGKPKIEKAAETISDVLKKVKHEVDVLKESGDLLGLDKTKEEVGALTSALVHLLDKFPASAERNGAVLQLGVEINELQLADKLKTAVANIKTEALANPIPLALTVIPLDPKTVKDAMDRLGKRISPQLIQLTDTINKDISSALATSVSDAAAAIGEAFTSGNIVNVFGVFISSIADGLKQIGKALIEYGIAKKFFQNISLSGPAAIAAGIGIEIFASALKASLSNIGKFATGGFVSGPGGPKSDSIPARLSNGEYVMSAATVGRFGKSFFDMLNGGGRPRNGGFADGGSVTGAIGGGQLIRVEVVGKMRGKDIYFTNLRAGATIGRNG